MAAGLQDGTVLKFGTGAIAAYGVVQSSSITQAAETAEAKGPNGHTTSIQQYDDRQELSLNFLPLSTFTLGTTEPKIGSTLYTPGAGEPGEGDTWVVKSVQEGKTVDGFATVDVTATNYSNLP